MSNPEKKVYLLVYSEKLSRSVVKECVDKMTTVVTWRFDMPNCFYLVSRASSQEISDEFREKIGENHGRFLVTEIGKNKQGWLPKETWYLLNNKELDKN